MADEARLSLVTLTLLLLRMADLLPRRTRAMAGALKGTAQRKAVRFLLAVQPARPPEGMAPAGSILPSR
eukprot:6982400-Alexandrium_andersonii.AAC.1